MNIKLKSLVLLAVLSGSFAAIECVRGGGMGRGGMGMRHVGMNHGGYGHGGYRHGGLGRGLGAGVGIGLGSSLLYNGLYADADYYDDPYAYGY